jgi:hypothetical protein
MQSNSSYTAGFSSSFVKHTYTIYANIPGSEQGGGAQNKLPAPFGYLILSHLISSHLIFSFHFILSYLTLSYRGSTSR